MAEQIIIFWRDIPAQVIIRKGRRNARRELSGRFARTIDRCAMHDGVAGAADYLNQWRKSDPVTVSDDLEAEADRAAAGLEAAYDDDRLQRLVTSKGHDDD